MSFFAENSLSIRVQLLCLTIVYNLESLSPFLEHTDSIDQSTYLLNKFIISKTPNERLYAFSEYS